MRAEWVPISFVEGAASPEDFGGKGLSVNVVDVRRAGDNRSLYHHFGSKVGLYTRPPRERRLLDRMEGAQSDARATARRPSGSSLGRFDFATGHGFMRLLAAPSRARGRPRRGHLAELCDAAAP